MESYFCCPHCGNKDVQATTETNTTNTGSNFSAGKGCLGYLLFGPLGILCGSCGSNQQTVTTNTTHWHCSNCGKKFRNPEEIIEENESSLKISGIVMGILGAISTVLILFVFREELLVALFTSLLSVGIDCAAYYSMSRYYNKQIETACEQKSAMKKFMKEKAVQTTNAPATPPESVNTAPAFTPSSPSAPVSRSPENQNPAYTPAEKPAPLNIGEALTEKATTTEQKSSKSPVRVYPNSEGYIFCPMCGTMQKADRKICFRCEVPFISENKAPSYRCGNCGYNEEYGEFCPNCGSNSKILNIQK